MSNHKIHKLHRIEVFPPGSHGCQRIVSDAYNLKYNKESERFSFTSPEGVEYDYPKDWLGITSYPTDMKLNPNTETSPWVESLTERSEGDFNPNSK